MTPQETRRALFIDLNAFARENFRSGLMIVIRDTLREMTQLGVSGEVLSIAASDLAFDAELEPKGFRTRAVQNILIHEHLLPYDPSKSRFADTGSLIRSEIRRLAPETILLNSPAIECHDAHISLAKEVLSSGARPKYIICDELFPERTPMNWKLYDKYVSLVRKMETFAVSHSIAKKIGRKLGNLPQFFPTPFDGKSIICKVPVEQREYIGLINHHPIKGRIIFDRVAELMPSKKFLVVENWPDVPPYKQKSSNVIFQPFIEDVRQLWSKIRILLVPSLCNEGRARVVTEAMMNHTPVVANAVGSLPELASPGLFFVPAPRWKGYRKDGSILHPIISRCEVEKASRRYVELIGLIDGLDGSIRRIGNEAAASAEIYWKFCRTKFKFLCKSWANISS